MYVKWFDTVMCYLCDFSECHFLSFSNFPPFRPPYVLPLAGDGTQMTHASIRRITLPGHCRRDIVGAQDKVSDRGIIEQRRMVSPSVGLPLVLQLGILPGRL
ncbi:unnamed protein product, partial [Staurois parvus]